MGQNDTKIVDPSEIKNAVSLPNFKNLIQRHSFNNFKHLIQRQFLMIAFRVCCISAYTYSITS